MCGAFFGDLCTTMSISEKKSKENRKTQNCTPVPVNVLRRVHGPAFDARYMSITEPLDDDDDNIFDPLDSMDRKRDAELKRPSFYMTNDHTEVLSEDSAWNIDWETFEPEIQKRRKRSLTPIGENGAESTQQQQQSDTLSRNKRGNNEPWQPAWQCKRETKWHMLGDDYYPSHLRTIECTKKKCYYDTYDCKPRNFPLRILQRRRGACVDAAKLKDYGFKGQYAEDWQWVDVSVNFCCDCVATKRFY